MTDNATIEEVPAVYKEQLDHMAAFTSAFVSSVAADVACGDTMRTPAKLSPLAASDKSAWTGIFNGEAMPA